MRSHLAQVVGGCGLIAALAVGLAGCGGSGAVASTTTSATTTVTQSDIVLPSSVQVVTAK